MKSHPTSICLAAGALLLLMSGCQNSLVFTSETKFGLDVSQSASQSPSVTMGYERGAIASFPVAPHNSVDDASGTNDAYSVLADFTVNYNPVIAKGSNILRINQFFATGMAARALATNPFIAHHLGERTAANLSTSNAVSGKNGN